MFESGTGDYHTDEWDGTYEGNDAPAATYYYLIDEGTGEEPKTGSVTIVR